MESKTPKKDRRRASNTAEDDSSTGRKTEKSLKDMPKDNQRIFPVKKKSVKAMMIEKILESPCKFDEQKFDKQKIKPNFDSDSDSESKTQKGRITDVSQGESMKSGDSFPISCGVEESGIVDASRASRFKMFEMIESGSEIHTGLSSFLSPFLEVSSLRGLGASSSELKESLMESWKESKEKNEEERASCLTNQAEPESLSKDSVLSGGNFDGAYFQFSSEKLKKCILYCSLFPLDLKNCILYCSLFPLDREFDEETMVQLWVAEGIFEPEIGERMEHLGSLVFYFMLDQKFILPCRFDNVYSHLKYRLNKDNLPEFPPGGMLTTDYFLHEEENKDSQDDYIIVEETKLARISNGVKHISLVCEAFDLQTSEVLKSFKSLRTLILFCAHGTAINHVPYGVFHHLKQLRTLDMQGFNISHLPDTVGALESLRYLDVSETRIKYLPESIGSLNLLQALKLKDCLELYRLPKRTKDLISLRHLDLDIVRQLKTMPSGIGSLTNLQTLRAFLIGKEDGCGIVELKNLANLSGSICISRLENVLNSEDARGAELSNKKHLSKLTFQWDDHYHDQADEEDILESLQPHFGIKELEILFFNGSKLPTWISSSSFIGITNILIFKCRNCSQLPSLGRLPSLKFLEIYEMNAIKAIDHLFCGNDKSQEHHAFPKLEKLTLDFMLSLKEWIGVEDGDFPSLLELRLKHCPKLLSLSLLSNLHSLRYLEIIGCTEFQSLPDNGIPLSVQTMVLKDCPKAKERCANSDSQDWYKIAHIPSVFLDYEEIFPNKQGKTLR